jgi:LysM repeat protein
MRRDVSAVCAALAAAALLSSCGGGGGDATATTQPPAGSTAFRTIPTTATTLSDATVAQAGASSEQVYTVQANDYYDKIVQLYGCESWEQIANYNDIEVSKMLFPGDPIKIPATCGLAGTETATADTTATASATGDTTAPATGTTTTVDPNAGDTYTVKSGDTVYGIATKFDVAPDALASENGWSDGINHRIDPGDVIKIPA